MKLASHIQGLRLTFPMILRVRETDVPDNGSAHEEVLLASNFKDASFSRYALVLNRHGVAIPGRPTIPEELMYLREGDILRLSPTGDVWVMYRRNSAHNSIFITERCNSRCIMCSQPPKTENDDYLVDDWARALPLMSPETRELGITGGEPTLLFERLLRLIEATKSRLPNTALHMLSNGRLFSYIKYAERIAELAHPNFMIGIPLYADVNHRHDFVVQAKGAFSETIRGVLNLGRVKQRVEIRFVIHQQTFSRLPAFARFVARNLPFVSHIALMGLELMGYARSNLNALWVDPVEYQSELEAAVWELDQAGLNVSVYNLPLCLLPKTVRQFARQSISDWKNIYFDECGQCAARSSCSGFFASSLVRRSTFIRPLTASEVW